MSNIDPYKVMRNTETLNAYRKYNKSVLSASQPWSTISLGIYIFYGFYYVVLI